MYFTSETRVASDEEVTGSLTDLYITRKNGHEVDDEATANVTLQSITERLWKLSK